MGPWHRIGQLDVAAVSDGLLKTSLELLNNFPREQARALMLADAEGSLFISVNSFAFYRPNATILIDAGAGNTMQPTLGKLPANLAAGGIDPGAVTHVLLTHLHPDHANGLVGPDGRPVFPRAEIVVSAQEHDFWMGEDGASDSEGVRKTRVRNRINLAPYADRIRRVREGDDVLGCTPILAAGHSPGHTCWRIEAEDAAMLAWGDLVHLAGVQIAYPDASLAYDLDADMATSARRRILDMAAAEGFVIAGAHLDAPGLGRVVRQGNGYAFAPSLTGPFTGRPT